MLVVLEAAFQRSSRTKAPAPATLPATANTVLNTSAAEDLALGELDASEGYSDRLNRWAREALHGECGLGADAFWCELHI
eukprot:15211501-Alexandrium_andersonii.AAC.1